MDARFDNNRGKKLTIGMATFDDYDGVYFTLQSLRLHHPQVQDRIEYLIVDNNPGSVEGEACQKFAKSTGQDGDFPRCQYVPYDAVQGVSEVRNEVFRQAKTEFVMCVDCHVLFMPGAIQRLMGYIDGHPATADLLQGVLLNDDLHSFYTHLAPIWEDGKARWCLGMLGQWASDERGRDPNGDPFEIPMHGLGVFVMNKGSWPGYSPHFRGFGSEGGYIHAKVKRQGGRTLCLPFLRWLHRFERPRGVPYRSQYSDRLSNYIIGHRENGLDEAPVLEHFVTLIGKRKVDEVLNELTDFDPVS